MDGLRQKLERHGLRDVRYMVINHQGEQAQRLHTLLGEKLSENITLYKQEEQQPDVWQTLNGQKDDFLIYDRCGRLTHHISLPYSIIGQGHIEGAIRDTYCKRICGECAHESAEVPEECNKKAEAQPDVDGSPAVEGNTEHGHGHGHGHGHHHHHGHGQHGDNHDFHPRGLGRERVHHHGHHHGNGHHGNGDDRGSHDQGQQQSQSQQGIREQGHYQDGVGSQRQAHLELGQVQQAHIQHMSQEALGAPVRP